jgi:hypothetical protein
MTTLITPLVTFANKVSCPSAFPQKGSTDLTAVTEMLHRVAVFFSNLGKCPLVVSEAMPEVWIFVKRLIELGSAHETVVESAIKVIMCALICAAPRCALVM